MRSRLALLVGVLLSTVVVVGPASAKDPDDRPAPSVRLTGNGYGHGHGMSQWGAQRQAQAGRSYQQILRFYYPGLAFDTRRGDVAVWISGDTTNDVVVVDRAGLRVKSLGSGKTFRLDKPAAAKLWRIKPTSGGSRSVVAWKGTGAWKTLRTVPGEAQFSAGGAPITLVLPGERRAYRGTLRSAAPSASSGQRDTVNVLPLDSYLKGVVPRESPASWEQAALRAQAVAARTYAAFDVADGTQPHYDICDTTSCQVYGGYTDEQPSTNAAIEATRGEILTYEDAPAFTQFSASNGGWMSAGSQPYLVAKRDPYDDTYRGWTETVTAAEARHAAAVNPADPTDIGTFRSLKVTQRDGDGSFGGRAVKVKITGSRGSTVLSGEDFRFLVGLMSTYFKVR